MVKIGGVDFRPTATYWDEDGQIKSAPFSEKPFANIGNKGENTVCFKLEADSEVEIIQGTPVQVQFQMLCLQFVTGNGIGSYRCSISGPSGTKVTEPSDYFRFGYFASGGRSFSEEKGANLSTGSSVFNTSEAYLYIRVAYPVTGPSADKNPPTLITPDVDLSFPNCLAHIEEEDGVGMYVVYIDEGDRLLPYRPFIDTGTAWEAYGQIPEQEQETALAEEIILEGDLP